MTVFDLSRLQMIDAEASGLPHGCDTFPIEFGFARLDAEEAPPPSWLVRPHGDWLRDRVWDPEAEKVHGLALPTLLQDGLDPAVVADLIERRVADTEVYSDNPDYDQYWLDVLYDTLGRPSPVRIRCARRLAWRMAEKRKRLSLGERLSCWTAIAAGGALPQGWPGAAVPAFQAAQERWPRAHRAGDDAARLAMMLRSLAR